MQLAFYPGPLAMGQAPHIDQPPVSESKWVIEARQPDELEHHTPIRIYLRITGTTGRFQPRPIERSGLRTCRGDGGTWSYVLLRDRHNNAVLQLPPIRLHTSNL